MPPELINAHLADAKDEASFTAASAKAVARWNELASPGPAALGGAAANGGSAPGNGAPAPNRQNGLSKGEAEYASGLKFPTA